MRLICLNCDAEYEVEASVIPPIGRDVQCSNCGHSWFQMPPELEAEAEAEAALYEDAPGATPAAMPAAAAAEVAAPPATAKSAAEPQAGELLAGELRLGEATGPEPAPPVARSLDETVLAVLREEAEREAEARKAESVARTPVMETQTEMGLQAAPVSGASAAARRVAQLKGVDPDAPPPAPPPAPPLPPTRRDLLPEIDEINSSLRATSEKRSGESGAVAATMPPPVDSGRRSFRTGFVLTMAVVVIGVLAYVMAPGIVQRIPQAAPAMAGYVSAVDSARLRLDASLQGLIAALRSMTGDKG